jgi:hypothetical protein
VGHLSRMGTRIRRALLRSCSALLIAGLGCGGDADDPAACKAFSACGGDPVGTWRSTNFCVDTALLVAAAPSSGLPAECEGAFQIRSTSLDADLTLTADGALDQEGTLSIEWSILLDRGCIGAASGGSVSSDQVAALCAQFGDTLTGPDSPFESSSCRSVEGGCSCGARQVEDISVHEPVQIDGSALVMSDGSRQSFCVDGDVLRVKGDGEEGGPELQAVYARVD